MARTAPRFGTPSTSRAPGAGTLPDSASPCGALEHPGDERHPRRPPYVALLEGPGVDRVALAHQVEYPRFPELLGRPLVQGLQPRHDDRVVEHPAEPLLVGDVAIHVERER